MELAPRLLRQPGICIGKGIQISVFTLFVGCCGVAALIPSPGGKVAQNMLIGIFLVGRGIREITLDTVQG